MRVCAISDLHGTLPLGLAPCDYVFVCGDIMPLNIQRKLTKSEDWLFSAFKTWVEVTQCKHIYLVAGNHDFWFYNNDLAHVNGVINAISNNGKLVYLQDRLEILDNGMTIYGCPWCDGPVDWAFSPRHREYSMKNHYDLIPDCDILLTHQPPRIKKVGCSYIGKTYEKDWGSDDLREAIGFRDIKYWFCGHIHSGDHNLTIFTNKFDNEIKIYNVSLKDEDYQETYSPKYLDI